MTGLRHHPHGETLMSHAARTLDPALSLVLSCHLQFCGKCRARLRAMDDVGGLLLEGLNAPEDDDFFKRTMRRFAGEFEQNVGTLPVNEAARSRQRRHHARPAGARNGPAARDDSLEKDASWVEQVRPAKIAPGRQPPLRSCISNRTPSFTRKGMAGS